MYSAGDIVTVTASSAGAIDKGSMENIQRDSSNEYADLLVTLLGWQCVKLNNKKETTACCCFFFSKERKFLVLNVFFAFSYLPADSARLQDKKIRTRFANPR